MDVIRVFQVLLRRWAVVVPVVLLGVAATVLAATSIPDEYTATGSLIVLDRSGGAGEVTPGILAEALQDGAVRDQVALATGSGSYGVTADEGGILRITARGVDAEQAASTANAVLLQIPVVLEARQSQSGGTATAATVEVLNRATQSSVVPSEEGLPAASASARLVGSGAAIGGERASKLLAASLGSTTVREQVAAQGGIGDYGLSTSRDLPTIGISAIGSDAASASATVELVSAQASTQLEELLELQGASATVTVEPLVTSGGVTVDSTGVLRSVVALLALTAAVGIAAAFAVEGFAEHRRRAAGSAGATGSAVRARTRQDRPGRAPKLPGQVTVPPIGTDDDSGSGDEVVPLVAPDRYGAVRSGRYTGVTEQERMEAASSPELDNLPDVPSRVP